MLPEYTLLKTPRNALLITQLGGAELNNPRVAFYPNWKRYQKNKCFQFLKFLMFFDSRF